MSFNIGIAILVNTRFLDLIIILYLRKHELDKYVRFKILEFDNLYNPRKYRSSKLLFGSNMDLEMIPGSKHFF
jgi:hypothetical protein